MKNSNTKKPSRPHKPEVARVSLEGKDKSVNIEPIENGFLITESGLKGTGKNKEWYNKKTFSPTNPVTTKGIKFGKK